MLNPTFDLFETLPIEETISQTFEEIHEPIQLTETYPGITKWLINPNSVVLSHLLLICYNI